MSSKKVIAILGVGPGLGMSMAHRFGKEGFHPALVSRTDTRHGGYRDDLAAAGIESSSYTADLSDPTESRQVLERITADLGPIDTVYFGPAGTNQTMVPLVEADTSDIRQPFEALMMPAASIVRAVLPTMLDRREGALFFGGGLSAKVPMPMLGSLVPTVAALRMYVLTLNETLKEHGVYAGTLTIGGLVERGDIYRQYAGQISGAGTLNPDDIADTAWDMYVKRDRAEAEFIKMPV